MVLRASSGVTSGAILASPRTLIRRVSPAYRLKLNAAIMPETKVECLPRDRLADHVGVAFELVPDRRSDEIGPVGVKPFLHHKVDVAEIDVAEVDGDLLAIGDLGP